MYKKYKSGPLSQRSNFFVGVTFSTAVDRSNPKVQKRFTEEDTGQGCANGRRLFVSGRMLGESVLRVAGYFVQKWAYLCVFDTVLPRCLSGLYHRTAG